MSTELPLLEALLDAKNYFVETDHKIDDATNGLARHALGLRSKMREVNRYLPNDRPELKTKMNELFVFMMMLEEAVNRVDGDLKTKTVEVFIALDAAIDEDAKNRLSRDVHSLNDPEVRRSVLAMTDGKCTYCSAAVSDNPVEGQSVKLFVEHVVPSSKGGPNHLVNYVPSCGSCNSAKGDRHVLHFVRKVQPIREERSTVVSIVRAGE